MPFSSKAKYRHIERLPLKRFIEDSIKTVPISHTNYKGKMFDVKGAEARVGKLKKTGKWATMTILIPKENLGKPNKRCPYSTRTQSLIFSKEYFTEHQAKDWAKEHGYKYGDVDEFENTYHLRQEDPSLFSDFWTITLKNGIQAIIGCPTSPALNEISGDVYDRGDRPSPRESATLYEEGYEEIGQDGNLWKIVVDKNGKHRWQKIKSVINEFGKIDTKERFSETKYINRNKIITRPEMFQGRISEFSIETVNKIVREGYDKSQDPIAVWWDEKLEKYVVIAGHSRWEASRILYEKGDKTLEQMPVKVFIGDKDDAIDYAILESNRSGTQEGFLSDLRAFKHAQKRGYNKEQMNSLFKPESYLHFLQSASYLNEKGQFIQYLSQEAEQSFPYLKRNSAWVGQIRKQIPVITDAHEQEIFDYFYKTETQKLGIKKDKFFEIIERKIGAIDFNPNKPLNLKNIVSPNAYSDPIKEQIKEVQKEIEDIERQRSYNENLIVRAKQEGKTDLIPKFNERIENFSKAILRKLEEKRKLEISVAKIEKEITYDIFSEQAEKEVQVPMFKKQKKEIGIERNLEKVDKNTIGEKFGMRGGKFNPSKEPKDINDRIFGYWYLNNKGERYQYWHDEKILDKPSKKEAWQMTQQEFIDLKWNKKQQRTEKSKLYAKDFYAKNWVDMHKDFIKQALSEGKTIPENILKDYTELIKPEINIEDIFKPEKRKDILGHERTIYRLWLDNNVRSYIVVAPSDYFGNKADYSFKKWLVSKHDELIKMPAEKYFNTLDEAKKFAIIFHEQQIRIPIKEKQPIEMDFIKRYLDLDNKSVSKPFIEKFIADIEKAAKEKIIRKTSSYADTINNIYDNLVFVSNEIEKTKEKSIILTISEKVKAKYNKMLKSGISGNKVIESVVFNKGDKLLIDLKLGDGEEIVTVANNFKAGIEKTQFITLEKEHGGAPYTITISRLEKSLIKVLSGISGNKDVETLTFKKINNALKRDIFWSHLKSKDAKIIEEAVKRGFLLRTSYSQAEWTQKGVDYFNSENLGSIPALITTAAGVATGVIAGRQISNAIEKKQNEKILYNSNAKIVKSADIINKEFEKLGFKGKWREFLGDPEPHFTAMIYGVPGSRKSTFAIELGNYFANNHGKVLFAAYEEGISETLREKIARLNATHENLIFSNSLPKDLNEYNFVIIDTINRAGFSSEDLINLKKKYPNISFIYIFQVTKAGIFKGEQDFEHDVDIVINCERQQDKEGNIKFTVKTTKNKYAPITVMQI